MGKKKGKPSVHFVWIKFKQKALTNNCAGMNAFVATLRLKFKFTAGLYAVIVEVLSEDFWLWFNHYLLFIRASFRNRRNHRWRWRWRAEGQTRHWNRNRWSTQNTSRTSRPWRNPTQGGCQWSRTSVRGTKRRRERKARRNSCRRRHCPETNRRRWKTSRSCRGRGAKHW